MKLKLGYWKMNTNQSKGDFQHQTYEFLVIILIILKLRSRKTSHYAITFLSSILEIKKMALEQIKTKIAEGGRVEIPVEYCRALQLKVGDEILVTLNNGEITIIPRKEALKRAQDIVSRYCSSHSLADELIAERRQEAENE